MRNKYFTKILGTLAVGATLCCLTTAQGALQFTMGTPTTSGSWTLGGNTILQPDFSLPFDAITITMLGTSADSFEAPGLTIWYADLAGTETTASWTVGPFSGTQLSATSSADTTSMVFDLQFLGNLGANGNPLLATAFELQAYNNGLPVTGGYQLWSWPGGDQPPGEIVVPEPTTVVAGALLLLPFGASMIRRYRK